MSKTFTLQTVEVLDDFRMTIEDMIGEIDDLRSSCTEGEDPWCRLHNAIMYLAAASEQLDPSATVP